MRVYYDRDADLNLIKGKNVLIIGLHKICNDFDDLLLTKRASRNLHPNDAFRTEMSS